MLVHHVVLLKKGVDFVADDEAVLVNQGYLSVLLKLEIEVFVADEQNVFAGVEKAVANNCLHKIFQIEVVGAF